MHLRAISSVLHVPVSTRRISRTSVVSILRLASLVPNSMAGPHQEPITLAQHLKHVCSFIWSRGLVPLASLYVIDTLMNVVGTSSSRRNYYRKNKLPGRMAQRFDGAKYPGVSNRIPHYEVEATQ